MKNLKRTLKVEGDDVVMTCPEYDGHGDDGGGPHLRPSPPSRRHWKSARNVRVAK